MRPSIRACVLATALALLTFSSSRAAADEMRYVVHVQGLACPFCAYGLERKLREVPGVEQVQVDLRSGTARVSVAEGRVVLPAALRSAVREAGFTIGAIELTASGEVRQEGESLWLDLGPRRRFLLVGDVGAVRRQLPGRTHFRISGRAERRGDREALVVERVHAS